MESTSLTGKELSMKCNEFLAELSRCKRGIPVARLFRHYFCEGNHKGCPLKRDRENSETQRLQGSNLFDCPGGSMKCAILMTRGSKYACLSAGDFLFACFTKDQGGDSI